MAAKVAKIAPREAETGSFTRDDTISGDAAQDLVEDVRARGYKHGYGEGVSGAVPRDVAVRKAEQEVSYGAVARFGKHNN